MNRLIGLVMAVLASCGTQHAYAAVTATVVVSDMTCSEKNPAPDARNRIWACVSLAGIADCPATGSVTVEWTSPDKWFGNSTYEAHWRSCTLDDGFTHTNAYRTVQVKDGDGKVHRAVGVWKVRVLAGDRVLAEGSFEVK